MAATKKVKEPTLKKLTVKSTAASKKGEKPTETKSKVTRGRKKKESTPSPEPDEREEGDGASESDDIDVDWTPDLTWKLVNSIMDDGVIKQGLFPAPKGNQSISKGGSKSKTDHYWALAEHIFTGDPTYGGVFSRTRTESADQKTWGRKIKNRLQRIIRDTRGFMGEMGQTGMGIMKATELDMSLENHLTNCWSRIRDKHPWFWTIKSIISERPNIVHTGVGNADDGFDMSYLGGEPSSDGPSGVENDRAAYESEDWQSIGDAEMPECNNGVQSDASIPTEVLGKGKKRKQDDLDSIGNVKKVSVDSVADNKKSKGPRASRSTSATPATSAKKAKPMSGVERFNDLAVREEETTQKALDLRKTKAMNERDKSVAKVRAQADIKMNKDKLRAELAQRKLELEFQFKIQMAQMGQGHTQQNPFNSFASNSTGGNSGHGNGAGGSNAGGSSLSFTDDLNFNLFENYDDN